MNLRTGSRLGPYEILAPIGAGGMGEVYKARDTRLERTVAIKILPPAMAQQAEPSAGSESARARSTDDRRARFEREAKTVAALNHPHICTLHDVGHEDGTDFLVMEYVAGETLAERLRKGRVPLDEALTIAAQVATALAAAHRQGVIHRDLKPGNVMLTKSGAKLLDFGLAKLTVPGGALAASLTVSLPTQEPVTTAGMLLGTVPYMAPEQLEGKEADARSDIFSFGAVLYEMLTARRPFEGGSQASVIAAILTAEPPPLATLQPVTPPALDRLVRKCLAKDPDARWQSASDVADELRWLASASGVVVAGPSASVLRGRRRLRIAIALLGFIALGGIAAALYLILRGPGSTAPGVVYAVVPVSTFDLVLTAGPIIAGGVGGVAVSRDGRTVVFGATDPSGISRLYSRDVFASEAKEPRPRAVEGTEDAVFPFLSPDGQDVGFSRDGKLWRVPLSGGRRQAICESASHGAVWLPDGRVVFGGSYQAPGLWSCPADGGTRTPLFVPSKERGTSFYMWPDVLPADKAVLFTTCQDGHFAVRVWSPGQGEHIVLDNAGPARYLSGGYLVYAQEAELRVVPFDPARLVPLGPSRVLAEMLPQSAASNTWAVSDTGTLVHHPSYAHVRRLVWKDRRGATTALPLKERRYGAFSLSPDGQRLAVGVLEGARRRVWTGRIDTEPLNPLSPGPDDTFNAFTPDGKSVAFTHFVEGHYNLFRTPADGAGSAEQVAASTMSQGQPQFHPTRGAVAFNMIDEDGMGGVHIWQKLLDPPGPVEPLVRTPGVKTERYPRFSSDGRWLAYTSNVSGRDEVWVQEYPAGRRMQLSVDGGQFPEWNPRGGEVFYWAGSTLTSVAFQNGRKGTVEQLFVEDPRRVVRGAGTFAVSADGDRFLMLEPVESALCPSQLHVVLNWQYGFKGRAR